MVYNFYIKKNVYSATFICNDNDTDCKKNEEVSNLSDLYLLAFLHEDVENVMELVVDSITKNKPDKLTEEKIVITDLSLEQEEIVEQLLQEDEETKGMTLQESTASILILSNDFNEEEMMKMLWIKELTEMEEDYYLIKLGVNACKTMESITDGCNVDNPEFEKSQQFNWTLINDRWQPIQVNGQIKVQLNNQSDDNRLLKCLLYLCHQDTIVLHVFYSNPSVIKLNKMICHNIKKYLTQRNVTVTPNLQQKLEEHINYDIIEPLSNPTVTD